MTSTASLNPRHSTEYHRPVEQVMESLRRVADIVPSSACGIEYEAVSESGETIAFAVRYSINRDGFPLSSMVVHSNDVRRPGLYERARDSRHATDALIAAGRSGRISGVLVRCRTMWIWIPWQCLADGEAMIDWEDDRVTHIGDMDGIEFDKLVE